jgi:hypothetical protein
LNEWSVVKWRTKMNECGDVVLLEAWFTKNDNWSSTTVSRSRDDLFAEGVGVATVADDATAWGGDAVGG